MSLSVLTSFLFPLLSRAEGDFDCLVSYVFPVLYDSRVHISSSLSHAPVHFRSCAPLFYPPPPFPLIGSRELLWFRVSLSRFPAFPFFQAWSCRAFAPLDSLRCCCSSSLASGMSVRGGRERKEGPKRDIKDHRMVGRGEVVKCSTESTHTAVDEGRGWMLTSVFYIPDLHTLPNHLPYFSLSISLTLFVLL